jgi:tetratricopeptide (TPR) repeat protein
LGATLHDPNRFPEAIDALEAARAAFERFGDGDGQALAHWGLGRVYNSQYDMRAAARHFEEALRLSSAASPDKQSLLLADAARAKVYSGDFAAALGLAEQSLGLAEQIGDAALIARALVVVVSVKWESEDRPDRQQIELLNRAEALARSAADSRTLSRALSARAVRRLKFGHTHEGLADRNQAIEIAKQAGETTQIAFLYNAYAGDCLLVGRWEEGRHAAAAGLELDPLRLILGRVVEAQLAWMEGRHAEGPGADIFVRGRRSTAW